MAYKKVSFSISDDFNKILEAIPSQKEVGEIATKVVSQLCEHGEMYAKSVAPVDTGELVGSISSMVTSTKTSASGVIKASSDHASYVEFGVGVVGEGTYPGDSSSWQYNVPTEFKDETGGWYYGNTYTHGNVANPFMYKTARELEQNAKDIVKL